eukprot:UN27137
MYHTFVLEHFRKQRRLLQNKLTKIPRKTVSFDSKLKKNLFPRSYFSIVDALWHYSKEIE